MKKQRQIEESSEGLETVKNEVPDDKFQQKQQVAPSTGFKTDAGDSSFSLNKKKAPGSSLKQEVASSVVRDASLTGGNSGDGASFSGARSSGSVGGIAGAANATPNVGKPSRSPDRPGKKLDRNSTKLNFIPSDQVLTEWDESKPLADSSGEDQGFNGTYRNEFARSQKRVENVPGALMFERSVDLITKDQVYFGQGQIIRQRGVVEQDALTRIPVMNGYGIYHNPNSDNYIAGEKGNFIPHCIRYAFTPSGKLAYLIFDEIDATVRDVDEHTANRSSLAAKISMNRAELWRESMDSKAGDEKADIWSCLPRAVAQPTATIGLLEAIEADVGNEVVAAYRKTETCFSYQLNVAHKDGQKEVFPGIYAVGGLFTNYVSEAYAETQLPATFAGFLPNRDNSYDDQYILDGCAMTMVGLYDSVNKYNTKADIILQPRGFRMHLQTADNNMDPLYADKDFIAMFDEMECFSTIDREYDPNSPVFMTDKMKIAHRISWDKMGSFILDHWYTTAKAEGADWVSNVLIPASVMRHVIGTGKNIYIYYPEEAAGELTFESGNIIEGNHTLADYTGGNLASKPLQLYIAEEAPISIPDGYAALIIPNDQIDADASLTLDVKCEVVLHADAYSSKIYRYQGGPARYMYSDLRNNYVVDVEHPLLKGLADYLENAVGQKYYTLSHGKQITVHPMHSTKFFSLWSLLLCAAVPFITKVRINSFRDLLYYQKNVEYPFNDALLSLSEVKTHAFSNFGFINYDTELEVKRMLPAVAVRWILPEIFQQVGVIDTGTGGGHNYEQRVLLPWYTNQCEITPSGWDDDASAMSMPSIRSGVRFASLDSLYSMTEKDLRLCLDRISSFKSLTIDFQNSCAYKYSSVGDGQIVVALDNDILTVLKYLRFPRELGWIMDAPYSFMTPDYDGEVANRGGDIVGTSCHRCTYWTGLNPTTHSCGGGSQSILAADTINVNRAANFRQTWFTVLASGTTPATDHGFALSLNQMLSDAGAVHFGDTYFYPFTSLEEEGTQAGTHFSKMMSLQKVLWTRIQKLPYVISPFDLKVFAHDSTTPNNYVFADLFDMMYWFGLGGFRASDYRESLYNREKEIVNQGYLFTTDPWKTASPLFKEGAASAGITVTKGFEL